MGGLLHFSLIQSSFRVLGAFLWFFVIATSAASLEEDWDQFGKDLLSGAIPLEEQWDAVSLLRIVDRGIASEEEQHDVIEAFSFAGKRGFSSAQKFLGIFYLNAEWGIPSVNRRSAIYWLDLAAMAGDAEAAALVAQGYRLGVWTRPDPDRASHYYQQAAEAGMPLYQTWMGLFSESRNERRDWLDLAAEERDPLAMLALGWEKLSKDSAGTPADALSDILEAHLSGQPDAAGCLGWWALQQGLQAPARWFEENPYPIAGLDEMVFLPGVGLTRDTGKILDYVESRKDKPVAFASYLAAIIHLKEGRKGESVSLFRDAALQGDSKAAFEAAVAYMTGRGVVRDPYLGYFFWVLALRLDCPPAYPAGRVPEQLVASARRVLMHQLKDWKPRSLEPENFPYPVFPPPLPRLSIQD